MISHYPLYVEVTFSLCYPVINGNKEMAKMTGMQTGTLAFVHLWETTAWQSTLIFMKEFFWINEQPLCSLSEVFLIIWTLFSLHATLYQKFIKLFFALLLLVLCWPIDILLCMFASTSTDFHKRSSELCRNSAWSLEIIEGESVTVNVRTDVHHQHTLTSYSCQAAAGSWCGWLSSWKGVHTRPWTWRLGRRWLCPRC